MAHAWRRNGRRNAVRSLALAAALLAALSVPASGAPPGSGPAATDSTKSGATVYIVQMADDPVVAYEGGRPGYARTAPSAGAKANPNSANVRRYQDFLNRTHADALRAAG